MLNKLSIFIKTQDWPCLQGAQLLPIILAIFREAQEDFKETTELSSLGKENIQLKSSQEGCLTIAQLIM